MPKKKSTKNTNEGTEKKRRNLKRNRTRGHDFERTIVSELKDIGYTGCVTSRSESKSMDDKKIDIIDTENKLPCYIQAKATMNTPDYFGIEKACPLKDKPFVVFWNKIKATTSTFRSEGQIVMIPKTFFYDLIKNYKNE
jgi:hypothetical protein